MVSQVCQKLLILDQSCLEPDLVLSVKLRWVGQWFGS